MAAANCSVQLHGRGDLRPARPAARCAPARADRGTHASRRARRELLVPAAPGRLRVDRPAGGRRRRGRHGLWRGLRRRRARGAGAVGRRCGRQSRGARPCRGALPARQPPVRARPRRAVRARAEMRRGLLPADDRAPPRPGGRPRPLPLDPAARRRGLHLDSQRAHPGAEGRGALGQPLARARVPRRGVRRASVRTLLRRRDARTLPRRQAALARLDAACRVGCRASARRSERRVLLAVHPGDLGTRLLAARGRARPAPARARLRRGLRSVTARVDGGELALVLHTHMPYVEGFGTWPFGEEWLWEAMATSYLPLLDVLEREDAALTLSLTPVLCDQLEAPGIAERFLAFLRDVRAETHRRDIEGSR